jgi:cytochrome c oxidase subunit 4
MSDKAHQEHTHHITPISVYVKTFAALTVLMLLTVAVVYFPFHLSVVNNAINLTIAVIKASLVVAFFMGVKYSTHLTKLFALAGFVWLTLMTITFGDYFTRGWEPVQGWYAEDKERSSATETESRSPLARERSNKVEVGSSGEPPILQKSERP